MNGLLSFRRRALLSLALLLVALPSTLRAEPAPPSTALRLSMLPLGTPENRQKMMAPMLNFVEAGLGRHVLIASPSTYLEQYRNAVTQRFDIGVVPPHFGGVLIRESGYLPIAAPKSALTHPALYVGRDSAYASLADLRGKRVATADRTTLVRLTAEPELEALGLRLSEDVVLVETHSHATSLQLLLQGEVDAALTSEMVVIHLHKGDAEKLRALYRGEPIASLIILVDGNLNAALRERIRYLMTEPGHDADDSQKPESPRDLLLRRPDWVLFAPVSEEYQAEVDRLGEKFAPIIHELSEPSPRSRSTPRQIDLALSGIFPQSHDYY